MPRDLVAHNVALTIPTQKMCLGVCSTSRANFIQYKIIKVQYRHSKLSLRLQTLILE